MQKYLLFKPTEGLRSVKIEYEFKGFKKCSSYSYGIHDFEYDWTHGDYIVVKIPDNYGCLGGLIAELVQEDWT